MIIPGFGIGMSILLICLIVWEAIWKGIALWKSSRNNQLAWFVVMLIVNSVGILPIIYIYFFQKKTTVKTAVKKK